MAAFPAAMLIMAGTFGLWRAGIISDALFCTAVLAVVLVLLGGTTWASDGIWHPMVPLRGSSGRSSPLRGDGRERAPLRAGSLHGARP
jgi:hypothetical protein